MKKIISLVLGLLLITSVASAQSKRGPLEGIFASWYSVTTTQTTIAFPYNSRDIDIHNGSTTTAFVDLKGGTIPNTFVTNSPTRPTIFQLDGDTTLNLRDYITGSISLRTAAGTASPVSVVVTY